MLVTCEGFGFFLLVHGLCSDRKLLDFKPKLFFLCSLQNTLEHLPARQWVSTLFLADISTVSEALEVMLFCERTARHEETSKQELLGAADSSLSKFSESQAAKEKSCLIYGPPSVAMESTGHPSLLATALQWLHDCRSTTGHDACRLGRRALWTPKSLIDTNVPSAVHAFRVVESDTIDATHLQYIALSHRWGDGDFLHLQKSNAESLKLPNKVEILPQTFQDAIHVCRALDIRWLWIDSLCILQGSDDASRLDWAEQAPEMCQVYGNASCNISATEIQTAHEGLFHMRDPSCIAAIQHNFASSSPLATRLQGPGKYELVDTWHFERRISASPLSKRAWAFQERILSRRSIHFMRDRLVWECRAFTTDERYPSHGPAIPVNPETLDMFTYHGPDGTDYQFCKNWWRQIERFSACDITRPDDRPAAIAGFARKVADISGCVYLAGHWREHLELQLLWCASPVEHSGRGNSASYRDFPSWSWLSIDGSVLGPVSKEFEDTRVFETAFTVIDISVGRADLQTSVQHGRLTLQGRLRHVRLSKTAKYPSVEWELSRPVDTCDRASSKISYQILQAGESVPDCTRRYLPDRTRDSEHYILSVGSNRVVSRESPSLWMILEVVDADRATYRRLGLYSILSSNFEKPLGGNVVEWRTECQMNRDITFSVHPLDAQAPGTPAATPGEHIIHLV